MRKALETMKTTFEEYMKILNKIGFVFSFLIGILILIEFSSASESEMLCGGYGEYIIPCSPSPSGIENSPFSFIGEMKAFITGFGIGGGEIEKPSKLGFVFVVGVFLILLIIFIVKYLKRGKTLKNKGK